MTDGYPIQTDKRKQEGRADQFIPLAPLSFYLFHNKSVGMKEKMLLSREKHTTSVGEAYFISCFRSSGQLVFNTAPRGQNIR